MNAPKKPYEPDDPTEIVAVRLPIGPDSTSLVEMVRTIAEEYALLGWSEKRILRLFENSRFAGPHTAYRALGAERVGEIVAAVIPRRVDPHG
jgi:hypothetical protein